MNILETLTEEQINQIFLHVQAKRQRERRAAQGEEGRRKRREYAREWRRRKKEQ